MKRSIYFLLLALTVVFFTSCQRDVSSGSVLTGSSSANSATIRASLSGKVVDPNQQPIAHAVVRLSNGKSVETDDKGVFVFLNEKLSVPNTYVKVEKDGYFLGSRTFTATENTVNYVKIQMLPKVNRGSFSAYDGGTVAFDGVTIEFPKEAIKTHTGSPYFGTVQVMAQYLDPMAEDLTEFMPGSLLARDKQGNIVMLQTQGMVAVELYGQQGQLLNIADGKEATITTTIAPDLMSLAPNQVPLWYFDEVNGVWKEEGMSYRENDKLVGKVSHFSFWNYDCSGQGINFDITVIDNATNLPAPNTHVHFTGGSMGALSLSGYTDNQGHINGMIPVNLAMTLEVKDQCGAVVLSQPVGPFTSYTNFGNVGITQSGFYGTVTGNLLDCNLQPVTNGFVEIFGGNTYVITPVTAGTFSTVVSGCGQSQQVNVRGNDMSTSSASLPTTVMVSANTTTAVGNLTVCSPSYTEFITYQIDGTPYIITDYNIQCFQNNNGNGLYINATDNTGSIPKFISFEVLNLGNGNYQVKDLTANNYIPNASGTTSCGFSNYPQSVGQMLDGSFKAEYIDASGATHKLSATIHAEKDY